MLVAETVEADAAAKSMVEVEAVVMALASSMAVE